VYLSSADKLNLATFKLELRFAVAVTGTLQFMQILTDSGGTGGGVNFTATPTGFTAQSTLGSTLTFTSMTMPANGYRTLRVTYDGSSMIVSTDDATPQTLSHPNSVLTQLKVGAQGTNASDHITGYRLTTP
jgi:hypothetical protein